MQKAHYEKLGRATVILYLLSSVNPVTTNDANAIIFNELSNDKLFDVSPKLGKSKKFNMQYMYSKLYFL